MMLRGKVNRPLKRTDNNKSPKERFPGCFSGHQIRSSSFYCWCVFNLYFYSSSAPPCFQSSGKVFVLVDIPPESQSPDLQTQKRWKRWPAFWCTTCFSLLLCLASASKCWLQHCVYLNCYSMLHLGWSCSSEREAFFLCVLAKSAMLYMWNWKKSNFVFSKLKLKCNFTTFWTTIVTISVYKKLEML